MKYLSVVGFWPKMTHFASLILGLARPCSAQKNSIDWCQFLDILDHSQPVVGYPKPTPSDIPEAKNFSMRFSCSVVQSSGLISAKMRTGNLPWAHAMGHGEWTEILITIMVCKICPFKLESEQWIMWLITINVIYIDCPHLWIIHHGM